MHSSTGLLIGLAVGAAAGLFLPGALDQGPDVAELPRASASAAATSTSPSPLSPPSPSPSSIAVLPALGDSTAAHALAVEEFIRLGVEGLEEPNGDKEGCSILVVDGADLARGDADLFIGYGGGECGGDGGGTQYKIRNRKVLVEAGVCLGCEGPDTGRERFEALTAPYDETDQSTSFVVFQPFADAPWSLEPSPVEPACEDCGVEESGG